MEEKKEMTFLGMLNELIGNYQREQRQKQEMQKRKERIESYLRGQCRLYARYGNHRVPIYQEEAAAKTSVDVKLEDIIAFATKIGIKWDPFWGENKIELILKDGKPEFCEEPPKDLLITEEDAGEPSEESAMEAINKMVAGMTKRPKSGEDDVETAEEDLMGPLSEEETADVVDRLRRATSERESKASESITDQISQQIYDDFAND